MANVRGQGEVKKNLPERGFSKRQDMATDDLSKITRELRGAQGDAQ
jgi:hypothetical protein